MKKIKRVLYIAGVAWLVVGIQLLINYTFKDENKIIDAFTGINVSAKQSNVKVVGNYGVKYMTKEDKEDMISYIASKLGIKNKVEMQVSSGQDAESIMACITGQKSKTSIDLVSVNYQRKNDCIEKEHYIVVTVEVYDGVENVLNYKNEIEKVLKELQITKMNSAVTLKGNYQKKLTVDEKQAITNQLLKQLQAKEIEGKKSEQLFTVYGYSPYINDYLTVESNKINVNVAFHYDEKKDQTSLYVASPVINEEY